MTPGSPPRYLPACPLVCPHPLPHTGDYLPLFCHYRSYTMCASLVPHNFLPSPGFLLLYLYTLLLHTPYLIPYSSFCPTLFTFFSLLPTLSFFVWEVSSGGCSAVALAPACSSLCAFLLHYSVHPLPVPCYYYLYATFNLPPCPCRSVNLVVPLPTFPLPAFPTGSSLCPKCWVCTLYVPHPFLCALLFYRNCPLPRLLLWLS